MRTNRPKPSFLWKISLPDSLRLNTVVKLSWLGTDPDGYIRGYEVSVDGGEWGFTTQTDSVFRFDLMGSSELGDVEVRVRAIDNLGLADPEPAELVVPIRNRPSLMPVLTIPPVSLIQ